MGLYCGWKDPVGRKAYADYFDFARKYESYFHPVDSYAEVALVFPRQTVHLGDDGPVESFRQLGAALLDAHILFDVLADENIAAERLSQYAAIVLPNTRALEQAQGHLLTAWGRDGGLLVAAGECASVDLDGQPRPTGLTAVLGLSQVKDRQALGAGLIRLLPADREKVVETLRDDTPTRLSRLDGSWMVRANAYAQPGRILLHLVNYNRDESEDGSPSLERPLAVGDLSADLRLPREASVESVVFLSPDDDPAVSSGAECTLDFTQSGDRVRFRIPTMLVYALIVVRFS
jgi:hypothetical protein